MFNLYTQVQLHMILTSSVKLLSVCAHIFASRYFDINLEFVKATFTIVIFSFASGYLRTQPKQLCHKYKN